MGTLREYYDSDFSRILNVAQDRRVHGPEIDLIVSPRLHMDHEANATFVSCYVPATDLIVLVCGSILRSVSSVLATKDTLQVLTGFGDQHDDFLDSTTLQFTGRVFLYCESAVPAYEREMIRLIADELKLSVVIRDLTYAEGRTRAASTEYVTDVFDGDVSKDAVTAWLSQFDEADRAVVQQLLKHFKYFSPRRLNTLLRDLHRRVLESLALHVDKLWFVPVGYVAKSGAAIAYFYRKENGVPLARFVTVTDLPQLELADGDAIVLLDDYVGSGHQAIQVWDKLIAPKIRQSPSCRAVFAASVGQDAGIKNVESKTQFSVIVAHVLSSADCPLTSDSRVFVGESDRINARAILQKYGSPLSPKYPLGYSDSQALVGFFYSTPNNTLPIFWGSTPSWKPLLPHGESFRDPDALLGSPAAGGTTIGSSNPARPIIETTELERYNIPADAVGRLLTEFQLLPIVLLFAPILKELAVEDSVVAALLRLVAHLKYLEHEKQPVRSGLMLVGSDTAIDQNDIVTRSSTEQSINQLREITALTQLVDGGSGATVIRANGKVVGNLLFPEDAKISDVYLPTRYVDAAACSRQFNSLLFLFSGAGRAAVLYRGKRLAIHRNAAWHYQPGDLDRMTSTLATIHHLPVDVLRDVLGISYELSDGGHGAIITVGDEKAILALGKPLKSDYLHWVPRTIDKIRRQALIGLMSRDGATIIAANGTVLQGMTTLLPPPDATADTETGTGNRHSAAAMISSVTNALCVVVSVEGPITIFSKGRIAFKMMG